MKSRVNVINDNPLPVFREPKTLYTRSIPPLLLLDLTRSHGH